jgi:hypothetical protein
MLPEGDDYAYQLSLPGLCNQLADKSLMSQVQAVENTDGNECFPCGDQSAEFFF